MSHIAAINGLELEVFYDISVQQNAHQLAYMWRVRVRGAKDAGESKSETAPSS